MGRSQDSNWFLRLLLGAFALGCLVLLFFFGSNIGSYARGIFETIVAPRVTSGEYSALSKDALIARLSVADADLNRIAYQSLLYSLLVRENENLRKSVGARAVSSGSTGRVIARPPQTNYDTLIIDIGQDSGVHQNDMAVYEGVALGRVITADTTTAVVSLFSSAGVSADVILGEPSAVAVAKGLGGGAFELSVPQGVEVVVGDVVRFPGTESLILGTVQSVAFEARDVSQKVRVALPFSFAELDFIRIISTP